MPDRQDTKPVPDAYHVPRTDAQALTVADTIAALQRKAAANADERDQARADLKKARGACKRLNGELREARAALAFGHPLVPYGAQLVRELRAHRVQTITELEQQLMASLPGHLDPRQVRVGELLPLVELLVELLAFFTRLPETAPEDRVLPHS